jgi:hypothetical protein
VSLQTLAPDSKASEIVTAMQRDGACIVRDVLSRDALTRLDADLSPWIERSQAGADDFTGRLTKRTGALIARCPEVRPVVTHPLILEAANGLLKPYCERIQLHLTQTIDIMPGQPAQVLHRDRLAWGGERRDPRHPGQPRLAARPQPQVAEGEHPGRDAARLGALLQRDGHSRRR